MGNAKKTAMLTSSTGIKIGVIGIVEKEWLDTINSLPPNLQFLEPAKVVQEQAADLRKEGAEMIIALTHQREPNDIKLAKAVSPGTIDLMVGGHDHFYAHDTINGVHLLRSGTDFKQLSYLQAWRKSKDDKDTSSSSDNQSWDFTITRRDITRDIPEDEKTLKIVNELTSSLAASLEKPVGYTISPLDARFSTVRLKESNMGNFVCDLMRAYYAADCCIMAGGTIRGDEVYPPGVLRQKDIMNCFPFEDPCVVLKLTGGAIFEALENGVSTYPALEGRFPQVSNLKFSFDPKRDAGQRIVECSLGGEPLTHDNTTEYKLVTRGYMAHGKDGFHSLLMESEGGKCEEIVSEENGMLISALLRQYFMSLRIMGRWKRWGSSISRHWSNVHEGIHANNPPRNNNAGEDKETHMQDAGGNPDDDVQQNRQGEVEERKQQESKDLVGGTGAAGHGEDQHQGSDLVNKAQASSSHQQSDTSNDNDNSNDQSNTDQTTPSTDVTDDESDDPESNLPATALLNVSETDRRKVLAKKVARHWWKKTGLKGHPGIVDDEGEIDGQKCAWTRGIVAKVEGRIVCLE